MEEKRIVTPDFVFEEDKSFNIYNDLSNPEKLRQNFLKNDKIMSERGWKPLVICDFDQVIVNIDSKWALLFYKSCPEYFEKFGLTDDEIFDKFIEPLAISKRTDYCVSQFLGIQKGSKYEKIFFDAYSECPDFYDDLPFTQMGRVLDSLSQSGKIRLYILSHCMDRKDSDSKLKFIQKNLPKAEYTLVTKGTKKSFAINEKNLNHYSIFIDDSLDNIEDVFLHTQSVGKEFIIPVFGYNRNFDYLLSPMAKNMSTLKQYEEIF